ncbi:hypothetical protein PsorP6_013279 [Peronosclerospora sorghi]|uniref:Uncharacterized protein n=1 Tax=Peronosclerospora sorghi TaxID=230839 RepID=A0ACC0WG82_9STRA|nr:hypothetical protein PsorP6_013279 [Peronosclerospora sorghi]
MLASVGAVSVFATEGVAVSKNLERGARGPSAWKRIGEAFASMYHGIKTLPVSLGTYCLILFCVQFGFTAYDGNEGQFFGVEVFRGDSLDADFCT